MYHNLRNRYIPIYYLSMDKFDKLFGCTKQIILSILSIYFIYIVYLSIFIFL